jgi:hypothetical protein
MREKGLALSVTYIINIRALFVNSRSSARGEKNRRRSPNRASFRCSFLKIQKANELRKKQPFVLISCEKSRFMQTIVFIYRQKRSERFHFRSERFCFFIFLFKAFFLPQP